MLVRSLQLLLSGASLPSGQSLRAGRQLILLRDRKPITTLWLRKAFITLAKAGGLSPYAAIDREGTPETEVIRIVLNEFELIAIGIQRGILDFTIYKRWAGREVLRYWDHAAPFITELRRRVGNPMIYREFEVLKNWIASETAPTRSFWWSRFI